MSITRGVLVSLVGLLFTACFALVMGDWLITQTLLHDNYVKQTFRDSGIYSSAAKDIITPNLAQQLTAFEPGQKLITPDMIQAAAEKSFSPSFIQSNSEKIIEVTEAWLNSNQPNLHFEIPITAQKNSFYSELSNQLTGKIKALPACPSYRDDENALLQARCVPRLLTDADAVGLVIDQIKAHTPYGDTLTEANITLADKQLQTTRHLPDYIGYLWLANILALGIGALLLLIIVWSGRWFGLLVIGFSAIIVAIVTLVFATKLPGLFQSASTNLALSGSFEHLIQTAASSLTRFTQTSALALGGIGIVISGLGVLWWRLSHRQ